MEIAVGFLRQVACNPVGFIVGRWSNDLYFAMNTLPSLSDNGVSFELGGNVMVDPVITTMTEPDSAWKKEWAVPSLMTGGRRVRQDVTIWHSRPRNSVLYRRATEGTLLTI